MSTQRTAPVLRLTDVHRVHGDGEAAVHALRGVSFTAYAGELVAVMGPGHVMLGSDDPFPLGEEQPGRLVRGSAHLTDDQKEAVLGHNAVRFFDL